MDYFSPRLYSISEEMYDIFLKINHGASWNYTLIFLLGKVQALSWNVLFVVMKRCHEMELLPWFFLHFFFRTLLSSNSSTLCSFCSIFYILAWLFLIISLISSEFTSKNHVMAIVITTPNLLCCLSLSNLSAHWIFD